MFEEEAKVRQTAQLRRGGVSPVSNESLLTGKQDHSKRSAVQAAKATKAGIGATHAMANIKAKAPEVFQLAKSGRVNVAEAKKAAALPEAVRCELVEQVRDGKPARQVFDDLEAHHEAVALIEAAAKSVAKKATALLNACRDLELLLRKHGGEVTGAGAGQLMAEVNLACSIIDQCLTVIHGKTREDAHA
jgi:hypothetical protein